MRTIVLSALLLAVAAPVAGQGQRNGAFEFHRQVDPMTDQIRTYIATRELNPAAMRSAVLVIRCDGDDLSVHINADQFLNITVAGEAGVIPAQWRFDDGQVSEEAWRPSTTGTAAFAPVEVVGEIVRRARPATRLAVRLIDHMGTPSTFAFSMQGAAAGLAKLPCVEQ